MFQSILYCEYNKIRDEFAAYYDSGELQYAPVSIIVEEFEDWVTENDAWDDHFWVEAEDCYPASAFTNFYADKYCLTDTLVRGKLSILVKFGGKPK